MSNEPYVIASAAKVLRVLKALSGHHLTGLSNTDLAKALNESPSTITRCLSTLVAEGLVMQLDTGRYALSITMLKIAQAFTNEMARTHERINELTQRINTGAY